MCVHLHVRMACVQCKALEVALARLSALYNFLSYSAASYSVTVSILHSAFFTTW